ISQIDTRSTVTILRRDRDVHRVRADWAVPLNRARVRQPDDIFAAYERRVRVVCDGEYPDALHLRGRLDPSHWVLEWSFARWVGTALGVADRIWQQIEVSNVLVLASVVWLDDLEDGELAVTDPARARDV